MTERSEQDALSRVLLITLGDETVPLRTLDLDASDAWLARLAAEVDAFDIETEGKESAEVFRTVFTQGSDVSLAMMVEYDVDAVLGGVGGIRARKPSKLQIYAALEGMVKAEDPFGTEAFRSVALAFGEPSVTLWQMVAALVTQSFQGTSTSGASSDTASDTNDSDASGAESNSSSDGPTPITSKRKKKRSA